MTDGVIVVKARVYLLPTVEGSRRGQYSPNHNFFGPDNIEMAIGFMNFPEGVELWPGESLEVLISFWSWPGIETEIYPGREWRIQEGRNLVALGTILEVMPS
jgi:elongation factor Tu